MQNKYSTEDVERFWGKVAKTEDHNKCWIWTGSKDGCGYGHIRIHGKLVGAHRVAYETTFNLIPRGFVIRHSCDNPQCCNPNHLSIGTYKDNMTDMMIRGRRPSTQGENNPNHKLEQSQVMEIRKRAHDGQGQRQLAKEFNVSHKLINLIVHKKRWRIL